MLNQFDSSIVEIIIGYLSNQDEYNIIQLNKEIFDIWIRGIFKDTIIYGDELKNYHPKYYKYISKLRVWSFNDEIQNIIPKLENLVLLEFDSINISKIEPNFLPQNLKYFYCKYSFVKFEPNSLPNGLESLVCGIKGNIKPNTFPYSLKTLNLKNNKNIKQNILPPNIIHLYLTAPIKKLEKGILPNSLKSLILEDTKELEIEQDAFPKSLENLTCNCTCKITKLWSINSIQYKDSLSLEEIKNISVLPKNLKILRIFNFQTIINNIKADLLPKLPQNTDHKIERIINALLPENLKTLNIRIRFVEPDIEQFDVLFNGNLEINEL